MTTLSSIRDFVTSLWPHASTPPSTPSPAPTSAPTTPSAGVGSAPTTFETGRPAAGPVLSPREPSEADIKKVAERVMNMIQHATQAKADLFADDAPREAKQLTRPEQKQVIDFANKHDAMMNEWAKTSPLLRGTRLMTKDELEAHFDEHVFQPEFDKLVHRIGMDALQRYTDLRSTATFLKHDLFASGTAEQRQLTADDLKMCANFANLFPTKLEEWAKTSPLLRGTRVMTRTELETYFWQHEFVPMVEQRMTEYFKAHRA